MKQLLLSTFLILLVIYVLPIQSIRCRYKEWKEWNSNISTSLDACNILDDSLTVNLNKFVTLGSVRHVWIKVNGEPSSWGSLVKGPPYSTALKLDNKCVPINVEILATHASTNCNNYGHSKVDPINCFHNDTRLKYNDTMGYDTIGVNLAQEAIFKSTKLWNRCIQDGEKYGIKILNKTGKVIAWDWVNRTKGQVVNLPVDRCNKTIYTVSYTFKGGQKRNATVEVPAKAELAWLKKNCRNGTRKETDSEDDTNEFTLLIGASVGAGVLVITLILIIVYVWRKRRADRRAEQEQTGTDLNDIYGTYGRGLFLVQLLALGYEKGWTPYDSA